MSRLALLVAVAFLGCSNGAVNGEGAAGSGGGAGLPAAAGAAAGGGGGAGGSGGTGTGGLPSGGAGATGQGGSAVEGGGGAGAGAGTGGEGGAAGAPVWSCSECPEPPDTLNDWVRGHDGTAMALHAFDDHVAVYVDQSVNRDVIDWVLPFASQSFVYMKRTYDAEHHYGDDRLYVFLHQASFGGGTISSYFDGFSTFRNAVDMGSNTWVRSLQNVNIDLISHELAHIVEGSSNGIHESPAFTVWGDSKWAEIFQYDLYVQLGLEDDAQKLYDRFIDGSAGFPRPGTYWFRDWFYPLWYDHGGAAVLDGFFKQLAEHFPTRLENGGRNPIYTRRMNLGELVHFYSGAAGVDLTEQAVTAFGDGFLGELSQARNDFPGVAY